MLQSFISTNRDLRHFDTQKETFAARLSFKNDKMTLFYPKNLFRLVIVLPLAQYSLGLCCPQKF